MRPTKKLPKHFGTLRDVLGFEEDDDKSKKKDDESDDDDDDDDDDEAGDDKEKKGSGGEDNAGLKSALQKERKARRALEKDLKALKAKQDEAEEKDKSEVEKLRDKTSKEEQKAQKLAARLRTSAVDTEIIKIGGKLKFRDIDDALQLVNRDDIEVDQDDDDPSDIQIDSESVEKALKALAKKKPHLLIAEGEEGRSGSRFGGGKKSQQEIDEAALASKYPALARGLARHAPQQ